MNAVNAAYSSEAPEFSIQKLGISLGCCARTHRRPRKSRPHPLPLQEERLSKASQQSFLSNAALGRPTRAERSRDARTPTLVLTKGFPGPLSSISKQEMQRGKPK